MSDSHKLAVPNATLDEMFPTAELITETPTPNLQTPKVHARVEENAKERGFTLNDEHWDVIHFLLGYYENCKDCQNARQLADALQEEFEEQGGRRYLYQLFPDGPVSTIFDLAGLPRLNHELDKGFGTSW